MKNLLRKNQLVFVLYAMAASFITYTAMYGIRQPYKAATYEGLTLWGISYKTVLLITQVAGYMLSKFLGIKIISEMKQNGRIKGIFICTSMALLSLLLFAVTPYPYNFIWMFFNGLPLGLVFGLVFSFLEGRRTTEILSVGLASSIILSSGMVKSTGKSLIENYYLSDFWMPFVTGSIYFIVLLAGAWMLAKIPPPDIKDIESRTERVTMHRNERKNLLKKFWPGLVLLIIVYIALTIIRDFRDGFILEIWQEAGFQNSSVLTTAELPIAFGVLALVGLTIFIKRNSAALWMIHALIISGGATCIGAAALFQRHLIDPFTWMVLTGFGLFLGYIMYNTILFERFIATFRIKGNIGFIIYLADSFGYLGSAAILLFKEFGYKHLSFLDFFIGASYIIGTLIIVCISISWIYFLSLYRRKKTTESLPGYAVQLS